MNEIVITGSTGVIGRRAVRELIAAGHRVKGVTRSALGRERLESVGASAVNADVFDEEACDTGPMSVSASGAIPSERCTRHLSRTTPSLSARRRQSSRARGPSAR